MKSGEAAGASGLPKAKWGRGDTTLLLLMVLPIVFGVILSILALAMTHSVVMFAVGIALVGYGWGVQNGAMLVRRFIIKWLVKIGAAKIEGKRGQEVMIYRFLEKGD